MWSLVESNDCCNHNIDRAAPRNEDCVDADADQEECFGDDAGQNALSICFSNENSTIVLAPQVEGLRNLMKSLVHLQFWKLLTVAIANCGNC